MRTTPIAYLLVHTHLYIVRPAIYQAVSKRVEKISGAEQFTKKLGSSTLASSAYLLEVDVVSHQVRSPGSVKEDQNVTAVSSCAQSLVSVERFEKGGLRLRLEVRRLARDSADASSVLSELFTHSNENVQLGVSMVCARNSSLAQQFCSDLFSIVKSSSNEKVRQVACLTLMNSKAGREVLFKECEQGSRGTRTFVAELCKRNYRQATYWISEALRFSESRMGALRVSLLMGEHARPLRISLFRVAESAFRQPGENPNAMESNNSVTRSQGVAALNAIGRLNEKHRVVKYGLYLVSINPEIDDVVRERAEDILAEL